MKLYTVYNQTDVIAYVYANSEDEALVLAKSLYHETDHVKLTDETK